MKNPALTLSFLKFSGPFIIEYECVMEMFFALSSISTVITSSFSFFIAQSNAFVSNKVYLEVHNVEVEPRPYFEVAVKNMHL